MRTLAIVMLAVLVSCGKQRATTPAPTPAPAVACAVPVPEPDSLTWREVTAEGFSFCVPASWRASGARGWRGEAGSITWGVGEYKPTVLGTTIGVARVPAGAMDPPMPPVNHQATEVIGGAAADLWDTEFRGTHYTGAKWEQARVYFEGKASGPRNAERQWAIYRTVHFTTTGGT